MRVFSHLLRSRVNRGSLIGCILICTGIYGVVYISPGFNTKQSNMQQHVYRNIQNVTPKITRHVIQDFNQSTLPKRNPAAFRRRNIIPDIPSYRIGIPYHGRHSIGQKSFFRQLPPLTPLDPSKIVKDPLMIIIVAYMHTGSTYIGSVFQQHPDTFYEYEALRSLQKQAMDNDTAAYLNGTTKEITLELANGYLRAEYVKNMLRCEHDKLDLATLIKFYFKLESSVMRDASFYFKCQARQQWYDLPNSVVNRRQQRMKKLFNSPESKKKVRDCLPYLTNNCLKAKIRVSKFIRMDLDSVDLLLKEIPQLKVIHLFRDPRAMMDSQVRKNNFGTKKNLSKFIFHTIKMCDRMRKDIARRISLKERYPENVMGIRYEDFTKSPVEASKALYKFTSLQFSESDLSFVHKTSVDAVKNSTVREVVWRRHMDQKHLDIVNQHCSDVLDELGYVDYKDIADVRNYDMPTNSATKFTDFVSS